MYNSVTLCGRLTRDLKLEKTESDKTFLRNTIAVNNVFNKNTDFINIVVWNLRAESMTKYLKKGSLILVEGRLQVNTLGSDENRRTYYSVVVNKVIFLETRKSNSSSSEEIYKKTKTENLEEDNEKIIKKNKEENDFGVNWD